jgi:hypothetical protein
MVPLSVVHTAIHKLAGALAVELAEKKLSHILLRPFLVILQSALPVGQAKLKISTIEAAVLEYLHPSAKLNVPLHCLETRNSYRTQLLLLFLAQLALSNELRWVSVLLVLPWVPL